MLGSLGLVPEVVHLLERCGLRGLAAIRQRPFDGREPTLEFTVRGPQHRFGIDVEVAGKIDPREQQVADLRRGGRAIARGELVLDLVRLLADLGEDGERIVPIKPDFTGLGLQFQCASEGGTPARAVSPPLALPPFPARSALLIRSHRPSTALGVRPRASPNT